VKGFAWCIASYCLSRIWANAWLRLDCSWYRLPPGKNELMHTLKHEKMVSVIDLEKKFVVTGLLLKVEVRRVRSV
jgi:hypothetical protein